MPSFRWSSRMPCQCTVVGCGRRLVKTTVTSEPRDRLDQRPGILAVEGEHRVAPALDGPAAPGRPRAEACRRPRDAPARAGGRRAPSADGRNGFDLRTQRHLRRQHREPRWHRNRSPPQAVPFAWRCAMVIVAAAGRGSHSADGELQQVRREQSRARRLSPQHQAVARLAYSSARLRRDEHDELFQIDDAQVVTALARRSRVFASGASRAAPPRQRRCERRPVRPETGGRPRRVSDDGEESLPA